MKILTSNSTRNDVFGGIHTFNVEYAMHSPENRFHVIELNKEKNYISTDNCAVHRIDKDSCTRGKGVYVVLGESKNFEEFNRGVERLVNEHQNIIQAVEPDIVMVSGTSLASYFLLKASRREKFLDRTVQVYSGVLEKEIGNYSGDQRYILGQIGKEFVSPEIRENVTYIFPSKLCRETVEEIHGVNLERSCVVRNGVSEEFFSSYRFRNPPEEKSLGYVGRIHGVKNLPFFLNINKEREDRFKLKIITDLSAASEKPDGKSVLKKMEEGEVFYYAPRLKYPLSEFYAKELSASVVSSFFETFCNVAVESVTSGTPCLLSNRAGAKEVFEDYGLESLVYPIDNRNSFEKSIESAEDMDFVIPEEISKEIYEDLSWKKVIKRYNDIFEDVVS